MTHLKVGDKAPNFEALDQDGNTIKLSDYKGKKLVVFFYPKASTPGCTAEACNLNDNFKRFESLNYEILGVSADSPKRQLNFKNKIVNYNIKVIVDVINTYNSLTIIYYTTIDNIYNEILKD